MWDGWYDASISSPSSFMGSTKPGMAKTFSAQSEHSYTTKNSFTSWFGRIPSIQFGQHWKSDEEFYDNQKVNGLPLFRAIRSSSWSQLKDIVEGCDPLTVPLSKSLYQGSENFWLRKLATGREVYVATMGEVSQVVFVSEILAQVRGRVIDLDRLSQNKALQDGLTLDKKEAIQHLTKLLVDQTQKWLPVVQADSGSQHQIAALQAEIPALKAKPTSCSTRSSSSRRKHSHSSEQSSVSY